jgi:hypothetical protein
MSTTLYFTGRVLPDWASFSLAKSIGTKSESSLGQQLDTKVSMTRGRIAVRVNIPDSAAMSLEVLRYYAESIARTVVDSYGFTVGTAFDVDMDAAVDVDGELAVFGPGVKDLAGTSVTADQVLAIALASPHLQRALSDFRHAIQVPHDTAFHAYRAIESICEHFRAKAGCEKPAAWELMRSRLDLTKDELTEFKTLADRQRHGELVPSIEESSRVTTLRNVRDVLARFVKHLHDEAASSGES